MRKYIAIAQAEWLDALQNREEIIIWILIESIPVFIMGSLWLASQSQLINLNLRPTQLITYYVAVLLVSRLTSFYFEENLQNQIKDGTFSKYLVKPISLPFALIPQNLGSKMFHTIFLLLPILVLILFGFKGQIISPTPLNLLFFGLSLILAYFIQFGLAVLVTSAAFWWEQAFSMVHAKWILDVVAGGYALPLFLYPQWLKVLVGFLPFQYIYFIPASIFTGQYQPPEVIPLLSVSLMWVFILFIICKLIWNLGLKRYSSVGN